MLYECRQNAVGMVTEYGSSVQEFQKMQLKCLACALKVLRM